MNSDDVSGRVSLKKQPTFRVDTSYMIPIVYRYIDSYSAVFLLYRSLYCSLSSSVPRYLPYLGTWLAPVSWPA